MGRSEKTSLLGKRIEHSHGNIESGEGPSFTKEHARHLELEREIKQNGPNLLTGDGMEAQACINEWNSSRSWKRLFSNPHKKAEEIYLELIKMTRENKDYLEQNLNFPEGPLREHADEIYGSGRSFDRSENLDSELRGRGGPHITSDDFMTQYVGRSNGLASGYINLFMQSGNVPDKQAMLQFAVFHANMLQRYRWDLTHPERAKAGAGRLSEAMFNEACRRVEVAPQKDYQALEAISYEVQRSRGEISRIIKDLQSHQPQLAEAVRAEEEQFIVLSNRFHQHNFVISRRVKVAGSPVDEGVSDGQYDSNYLSQLHTLFTNNARAIRELETRVKELLSPRDLENWLASSDTQQERQENSPRNSQEWPGFPGPGVMPRDLLE